MKSAWRLAAVPTLALVLATGAVAERAACPSGSANCSAGAALVWRRTEFDGLGRPTTERIAEHARRTTYNALGWKLTESVWGNTSSVTRFTDHDPYGRPGTITLPGQPATRLTYQGDNVVTRESQCEPEVHRS